MEKLNPKALAESGDWDQDEREGVQKVTPAMIRQHVTDTEELTNEHSAQAFSGWLDQVWNDFNEDGDLTNGEVIAGALADWRGKAQPRP